MPQRSPRQTNERRLGLIVKKFTEGLTEAEADELAELKKWVEDWTEKRFPRHGEVLDEMDKRLDALKAKIIAKKENQA